MRRISRIEFEQTCTILHYHDDADPRWVDERVLVVDWRQDANVVRLTHVAYHLFDILIENPKVITLHDEALLEWVGRLFAEHPAEGHERP